MVTTSPSEGWETSHTNREKIQQLNNSKSVSRNCAYTFQNTKNYLLYCSIFQIDGTFFLKNEGNFIKKNLRAYSDIPRSRFCPTQFLSLHPGLIENWEYQIISMMKRKLQEMTAERLSLARAQTMKPRTIE